MKSLVGPLAGAATILSASLLARAEPITYCPQDADSICYSVGVPEASASSDSGNIFFQISAPSSYQWVALGTGTGMDGSNIFLMYQDGTGNLTMSPRQGTFHTPPQLDTSSTAAKLTVLAGSGVSSDGKTMTANVMCSNCETWFGGGTLQLTDTQSGWISAWKSGDSLATTDKDVQISQHDNTAIFQLDLTQAVISADSNPFVGNSSSSASSSGSGSGSGSSSGSSSGGVSVISATALNGSLLSAHGLIMAITMVVLYPLGALLMPLLGKWYIHAAWQLTAFCLMIAGFGLGIVCAMQRELLFQQAHTIIGTTVVCCLVIQPLMGILHHRYYVKNKKRGLISWAHIWWGRTFMTLGVINGGLGLQLAGASSSLIIAYSVVACIIFLCYAIAKVWASMGGKQPQRRGDRIKMTRRYEDTGSNSSPTSPAGGTPPLYRNNRPTYK